MAIEGYADIEGTGEFMKTAVSKGIVPDHFRTFLRLRLTSLGLGTYLGEPDAETDRLVEEAVRESISSGAINVIDTAINYRFQKAERSVGRALKELIELGDVKREQLFVATKNGYLTHDADSPLDFWTYIHRELVKPGVLKPEEIAGQVHGLSASFLRDQLAKSLSNLGLGCIDLLYLHNAAESWLPEVSMEDFLGKLEDAFAYYEEERTKGRIRFYGMATWSSLRVPEGHHEHLSLETVVKTAEKVGGQDHGFKFIQLPLNLAMNEALAQRNQRINGELMTTLDAAEKLGIAAFTSAPLLQGRLALHSAIPSYERTGSRALYLLQYPRSAHKAIIAPLVGHKQPRHIKENLMLAQFPPLLQEDFRRFYSHFVSEQA